MIQIKTSKYSGLRSQRVHMNARNEDGRILINEAVKHQQIIGFGGAFTEAATNTLDKMSSQEKKEVLTAYFDPVKGLGYTLGRVAMNSCDFSFGNYSYIDDYDVSLDTFDISRERKHVIPTILEASRMAGQPINILASPWSPPAWMKSNGKMTHGGKLLKEFYPVWARYYLKFIDSFKKADINIFAVSVQNEPAAKQIWESCLYTAEEERDFVKYHLGPLLSQSEHSDVKILIWDHNRDLLVKHASTILEDKDAAQYVWGTALHWYVSEDFEQLSKLHARHPGKHLLFTEGCIEGGVRLGDFTSGERYMRNMIGDFNNYCEGYIDWNLVLDETGGPNHVGNYCDAPIICDPKNNQIHYNTSFEAIGHFSRYVKPGAYRIESTCSLEALHHVAFKNPDGSTVLIIQNETERDVNVLIDGKIKHNLPMERRSYITLCF